VLKILALSSRNSSNQNFSGGGRRGGPSFGSWNGTTNQQLTVRAVANCDEVELFLNNLSLGRHAVAHNLYYSDWNVPYSPGVLSAIGYNAGRPVATNELRTAGAAARIQIMPVNLPFASELEFLEINIVDEAGLVVSDATPAVTVQVKGAGRLIGLDTGDLSYVGLFKTDTRNAYQGRLLATVQRTVSGGDIHVTASSPELPTTLVPAR